MAQATLPAPSPSQIRPNSINGDVSHGDGPIVLILERFSALPADCLDQLFADFETASRGRNLRALLDTISDWAATAEVYAHLLWVLNFGKPLMDVRELRIGYLADTEGRKSSAILAEARQSASV